MNDPRCGWAGLTCRGNATIILEGTNHINGFYVYRHGIYVPEGKTLTIKGDGSLTAIGSSMGAGIGGGLYGYCGSITINNGKITAVKGRDSMTSVGPSYNYKGIDITVGGVKYTATEDTFTYSLEPNTKGNFTVNIDVAGA